MNLLASQVDPKMWNLVLKFNFLRFWPPEKSVFELMTNLKFSFSESGPGTVLILPKPIFLFKFSNFYGYLENAPNHTLSSNSTGKILKMTIKSEALGLCSWNFWNFLFSLRISNGEYFNDFKIFDLTLIWWIWLEWPKVYLIWLSLETNHKLKLLAKKYYCSNGIKNLIFSVIAS